MPIQEYTVYAKTDVNGNITALNSSAFVNENWGTEIDRGVGDKYHHAQGNYFPGGLYTYDGIPRYKLTGGQPVERTEEEIQADRPDPLKAAKDARIQQSKDDLEAYLEAHPITWTDGQQYSITREKQQQLSGKMAAAQAAQILSQPYTMEWNDTGMVCREWSMEDIAALGLAIDARITALVKYQQTQEMAMQAATSMDELNAIEVDYDTVQ